MLKRHWGVSIEVYSVIWTNPFDHLSSYANREWINVVSTRSTGFRTKKRYAILLELPVTPAFDIWYILADILRCPHNEVKISQRWSLIRDGNYQLYWCWKVKLKVGCYNLMLAAKVECWGLKLIFGSLSWVINFECWNVKLKVECYITQCQPLKLNVEDSSWFLAGVEHHTCQQILYFTTATQANACFQDWEVDLFSLC